MSRLGNASRNASRILAQSEQSERAKKEAQEIKRKQLLESYNVTDEKLKEIANFAEKRKKLSAGDDERSKRIKLKSRLITQSQELTRQQVCLHLV